MEDSKRLTFKKNCLKLPGKTLVIRRYSNRKMYCTDFSDYCILDDLVWAIQNGYSVEVETNIGCSRSNSMWVISDEGTKDLLRLIAAWSVEQKLLKQRTEIETPKLIQMIAEA